jgi:predicted nucleic acid-binding Zn ribbon protein
MTDAARCVVCSKPVLPGERPASGEDVHAACDRRTHVRPADVVKCIVCNEPIRSNDGTARLDDVLVHGTCYVRARKPLHPSATVATNGASIPALKVGWTHRLLRRIFGPRTATR